MGNQRFYVSITLLVFLAIDAIVLITYSTIWADNVNLIYWRHQYRVKGSRLEVHNISSEKGGKYAVVRGVGFGDPRVDNVDVIFGRRLKSIIIEHTPTKIVCEVPPSEFDGIGYEVTVRVAVVKVVNGLNILVPFRNETEAWWTYRAAKSPTRVANIAMALIWKDKDFLLLKVIRLFAKKLGRDWRFQLLVYNDVPPFYLNDTFINDEMEDGRLEVTKIPHLTYLQLARMQVNASYWEMMHGDRILVFQADSVPCSRSTREIDYFFKYNYVGAPWSEFPLHGGNSGLSLRNKTMMIKLLKDNKVDIDRRLKNPKWKCEDLLISEIGTRKKLGFATKMEGVQFSVESMYWPNPWGVHNPWSCLAPVNYSQLLKSCPELEIIAPGKKGRMCKTTGVFVQDPPSDFSTDKPPKHDVPPAVLPPVMIAEPIVKNNNDKDKGKDKGKDNNKDKKK